MSAFFPMDLDESSVPEIEPAGVEAHRVRNVVLLGPSGAGKTALVRSLSTAAGVSPGPIAPVGPSTGLTATAFEHAGQRITLLDTPGHPDFVLGVRAGLRAADAALFVVSALAGLDPATRLLWEECAAQALPRAIVVTGLDSPRADFEEIVAICQRLLGGESPADPGAGLASGILPLSLPLADEDGGAIGLLDLIDQRITDHTGGMRVERIAEPEHLGAIEGLRATLMEAVLAEAEDGRLLDNYLVGLEPAPSALRRELQHAVARASLFPVLGSATGAGVGATELLSLLVSSFPSPADREIPPVSDLSGEPRSSMTCDPEGPLLAEVIALTAGQRRTGLVRVFSGTLRPGVDVNTASQIGSADLESLRVRGSYGAGSLISVGLERSAVGATLSGAESPLLLPSWALPEALHATTLHCPDTAALDAALTELVAEDPTLRVTTEDGESTLHHLGTAHLDDALLRLRGRLAATVESTPQRAPLRETFTVAAAGTGVARGAQVSITVRPQPPGTGVRVEELEGVPDRDVEEGLRAACATGVSAGYPLTDIAVAVNSVVTTAHAVDVRQAAGEALRDAASQGSVRALEPIAALRVTVGDEYVDGVVRDLTGRRGKLVRTESDGRGRTEVRADVPEREISRYAMELRSVAHGTGSFTREYARHDVMPSSLVPAVPLV